MALPLTVLDPGVINVESQAYPRPLDPPQALRPPTEVQVGALVLPQLPPLGPGSGSAAVAAADSINVSLQAVRQPVSEFIVTQSGNFQTNATNANNVRRTIRPNGGLPSPDVVTTVVNGQTQFQVFFLAGTNLFDFGVSLVGTEARFPNSAPARAPENVPTGLVLMFSTNWILVDGTDFTSTPPAAGNVVDLDVGREAFEPIFDQVLSPLNVNVFANTLPIAPDPVDFDLFGRVVNVFAGTVGQPPIVPGGLQALPRMLGTTFIERSDPDAISSPPIIDSFQ